jgi:serine/threonine protein kinase
MSSEQVTAGTIFGRDFRVLERLAAGGMGTVYVAQQLSTGKRRALKVMHAQYEGDERARERFIQEARVGASIDSDHIVEMVGAGIDDETNTPWIAMELLAGQDLKQRVSERGQLPRDEVLEICRQLCHALGEAHQRGLVHRDLKPENIFLAKARREGVPFTVKLLDFGIAKLVQENQTQASHTQAVGSPRWMAPEQAERGARISPATDVWALGLIVFNLLTGRCYWRTANSASPSVMQQMCEVIMDPIEPASARAEEYGQGSVLPPGFDEWFGRCVNRDVAARFPDASAAMNALGGVLAPASSTQRRSLRPASQRPRGDFRLDEPLPRDAPFSLQGAAPASSMPPPDPSRSLTPPELSRSGAPLEHSRSLTPPSAATDVSAPVPAVAPPGPPARNRGVMVVVAASVLTLLGVTAVALTRRPGPATQPPPPPVVAPSRPTCPPRNRRLRRRLRLRPPRPPTRASISSYRPRRCRRPSTRAPRQRPRPSWPRPIRAPATRRGSRATPPWPTPRPACGPSSPTTRPCARSCGRGTWSSSPATSAAPRATRASAAPSTSRFRWAPTGVPRASRRGGSPPRPRWVAASLTPCAA